MTEGNPHDPVGNVMKRLTSVKHKIAIMSGKGGVGKSTVAANLAAVLVEQGHKVGLLDVDINGPNIPKMLGIEDEKLGQTEEGILPVVARGGIKVMSMAFLLESKDSPVIWRGPLKMQAIKQFLGDTDWGELDYLIIDLPPGTGDEALSIAQLIPKPCMALIVTTPQDVALLDSRKAVNFAKTLNMDSISILENMSGFSCPHCGKDIELFKTGGGERAAKEMGVSFLGSLPIDPAIVESGDQGEPFAAGSGPAKDAFTNIIRNIESKMEE